MIIKEYKSFIDREVVSFDFDGVLHSSMIPGTLHPINFTDVGSWSPKYDMIELLRKEKKNHKIIITTARDSWNKGHIEKFLKLHNIEVDDIILTNNQPKRDYLVANKVIRHYDDNAKLEKELEGTGIEFILIK
jgi:hypothetical protein